MTVTPAGRLARRPVDRSSITVTTSPAWRYASTTWEPMKPAPPVTTTLRRIASLQTEQPLERLEQPVPPTGFGRRLDGDRGLMQELVEQRLTEMLELAPVLRAQVRQSPQQTLDLVRPHVIHAVAELFKHRHHRQAAVPRPEPLDLLSHDVLGGGDVLSAPGRRVGRDGLKVVDVVQEDVLELRHRRLHVAGDRKIKDAERTAVSPRDGRRHAVPGHDRVRGGRGAEDDVGVGEVV